MNAQLNSIKLIEPFFTAQLTERFNKEIPDIGKQQEALITSLLKNINNMDSGELEKLNILDTLTYLHKTHVFYLNKILPEIEQRFTEVLSVQSSSSAVFLLNVFSSFKTKFIEHIREEEKDIFPYVRNLMNQITQSPKHCSLKDFVHDHDQVPEIILEAVINGLQHLIDKDSTNSLLNILQNKLKLFNRDLKIHSMIEDHVLLPHVLKLEQQKV